MTISTCPWCERRASAFAALASSGISRDVPARRSQLDWNRQPAERPGCRPPRRHATRRRNPRHEQKTLWSPGPSPVRATASSSAGQRLPKHSPPSDQYWPLRPHPHQDRRRIPPGPRSRRPEEAIRTNRIARPRHLPRPLHRTSPSSLKRNPPPRPLAARKAGASIIPPGRFVGPPYRCH
jgi:hypothetical protein